MVVIRVFSRSGRSAFYRRRGSSCFDFYHFLPLIFLVFHLLPILALSDFLVRALSCLRFFSLTLFFFCLFVSLCRLCCIQIHRLRVFIASLIFCSFVLLSRIVWMDIKSQWPTRYLPMRIMKYRVLRLPEIMVLGILLSIWWDV